LRFCILAMVRTGSNRLAALLDSHSRIVCHGELFHVMQPWWSRHCPVPSALDRDRDRRRDEPLGWLDDVFAASAVAAPEATAIGFKLQITDRARVLEHVLLESDMKLVLLYRANRLAQYASARTAAETGRWASTEPSWRPASPVAFDLEDFLAFVEQQALACDLVHRLVTDRSRFFVAEYQEIGTPAANAALLAFLGLEPQPLTAPDERLGSPVIRERFADPDGVALGLARTVWRPWLEGNGT
jgi:hypothetical protein